MKIKFFLRQAIVDYELPEAQRATFNFMGLCRGIRCDGFFQTDTVHIPYSEIIAIGLEGMTLRPIGNAPTTETKQ